MNNDIALLFLAANPASTTRLALDKESREIYQKLRASGNRDLIRFETRWAVRAEDLQSVLLEVKPYIVHFSGHGSHEGIALDSDFDDVILVSGPVLAELFGLFKDQIKVVVLNSCFSEVQARAIVEQVDYVVGMSESVDDAAAITFSAAFYQAIGYGRSIQDAFDLGVNQLRLGRLADEADIPVLMTKQQ